MNKEAILDQWHSRKSTVTLDQRGEVKVTGSYKDILSTRFTLELNSDVKNTTIHSVYKKLK